MGRRSKNDGEYRDPPAEGAVRLFGARLDERHRKEWEKWAQENVAEVTVASLSAAGCHRETLIDFLMEVHASRYCLTHSKEELQEALEDLFRAESWLEELSRSDERYFLLISPLAGGPPSRFQDLLPELRAFRERLRSHARKATRRESHWRNLALAYLVRYVKWSTGRFHDRLLTELVGAMLENYELSMTTWRRDHKALWTDAGKREAHWDALVAQGKLPPPGKRNK